MMAAYNGISEADVQAIVAGQVAKAKEGDPKAIEFVMKTIVAGGNSSPVHLTQNNYYGDDGLAPDGVPREGIDPSLL